MLGLHWAGSHGTPDAGRAALAAIETQLSLVIYYAPALGQAAAARWPETLTCSPPPCDPTSGTPHSPGGGDLVLYVYVRWPSIARGTKGRCIPPAPQRR